AHLEEVFGHPGDALDLAGGVAHHRHRIEGNLRIALERREAAEHRVLLAGAEIVDLPAQHPDPARLALAGAAVAGKDDPPAQCRVEQGVADVGADGLPVAGEGALALGHVYAPLRWCRGGMRQWSVNFQADRADLPGVPGLVVVERRYPDVAPAFRVGVLGMAGRQPARHLERPVAVLPAGGAGDVGAAALVGAGNQDAGNHRADRDGAVELLAVGRAFMVEHPPLRSLVVAYLGRQVDGAELRRLR